MAWPAREAVARCRAIGAAPVVAHPMDLPLSDLEKLIAAGLLGVEAICSYHAAAVQAHWQQAAAKYELLVTAGSDFHGARTKPGVRLGGLDGADYRLVERLRDAVAGLRRSA
jgi:predicted metal-dependent phosphoesterase TrpH